MIRKEASPKAGSVRVTFEIPASLWASHIYLVGDFNNWNRRATPFTCMHNGVWRVSLDLPARRRYEFRYLIDEHWCTDHNADGCLERSGFGLNSIVETTLPLQNLASDAGDDNVHEAVLNQGMDFATKPHL